MMFMLSTPPHAPHLIHTINLDILTTEYFLSSYSPTSCSPLSYIPPISPRQPAEAVPYMPLLSSHFVSPPLVHVPIAITPFYGSNLVGWRIMLLLMVGQCTRHKRYVNDNDNDNDCYFWQSSLQFISIAPSLKSSSFDPNPYRCPQFLIIPIITFTNPTTTPDGVFHQRHSLSRQHGFSLRGRYCLHLPC